MIENDAIFLIRSLNYVYPLVCFIFTFQDLPNSVLWDPHCICINYDTLVYEIPIYLHIISKMILSSLLT